MGIFDRIGGIIKSNVNDVLDKAEDPAKMVDQTLRDLREDLAEVKKETAGVMAEEKRCKRELDECDQKIAKMLTAAKNAKASGNLDDARTLLVEKQNLENQRAGLEQAYNVAHANATKVRQAHDKLVADIKEMESRRASIKAKVAVAKTQEHINRVTAGTNTTSSLEAFDRMEAKANQMLDSANAEAELNTDTEGSDADDLANKYAGGTLDADIEAELAKL